MREDEVEREEGEVEDWEEGARIITLFGKHGAKKPFRLIYFNT